MDDLRLQPRWIQENIPTVTCAGREQKHPHQPVDQLLHDHRAPRQHAAAVSGREEDRSGLGAAPAPHLTPAADSRGVGGGADLPAPAATVGRVSWLLYTVVNIKYTQTTNQRADV